MTAFEVKYRPIIVYADTFADLAAIPADLTLTKHAFILDSGDEYVLEPKSTVWQKLTDAEAAAIAELEAELDANRIYNTASSAAVCSFSDGADGIPMKSLIAEIAPVQAGSGDPSPDNVRPISGWDGVTVTRCGKNLLNPSVLTTFNSGTYLSTINYLSAGSIPVKPSTQYTLTIPIHAESRDSGIYSYDANGTRTKFVSTWNTPYITFTTPSDSVSISFYCWLDKAYSSAADVPAVLSLGSSSSAYVPYTGQTIPIAFPTPPGTVYGGTLDVISGVLTVTDANIASYAGETLPGTWISDRDVYAEGTTPTTGAQVVYKLAEPLVYQLDPVTIESLLGTNNLFADTGDTSAEYCADPKMYIDSAIASAVAALS